MADLQQSLRQTERAVEAVQVWTSHGKTALSHYGVLQGERDELRNGVDRMRDELRSLQRSNSLLIRRKQQWSVLPSLTLCSVLTSSLTGWRWPHK